jgi:hypothetical protein
MKKTLGLVAAVALTATLSACGGDDDSAGGGGGGSDKSYCDTVKDAKAELDDVSDINALDQATFDNMTDTVRQVEESAPDDIKAEWGQLGDALEEFQTILSDAGISLDDLSSMQSGELPEGVDQDALLQLGERMEEFTQNTDMEAAAEAIEQQVKDECDIVLDDDSESGSDDGTN